MTASEKLREKLREAIDGIESGRGPEPFAGGHGLQSRVFRLEWEGPALTIDVRMPCWRVLSGETEWTADYANAGAACRLALLLLAAEADGTLLADGESRIWVACDQSGARWRATDADGVEAESGEGWNALVARLEALGPADAARLQIIWP